jgi:hypothetical protein
VLGAGVPAAWANEMPGVAVRDLPVGRERINFTMMRQGDEMVGRVSGSVTVPAGGILVYAPFDCRPGSARIDGMRAALTPDGSVSVRRLPAEVRFDVKGC